ncbi:TetR/AcrR family transcriptional regulator [Aquihabitans daechungensis]|uniref:TetR/AcrR family transcriptional regulator n=1 Tax=Aquihabitans daechungensis TaxID=1052257 RepID=UPI003BA0FE37
MTSPAAELRLVDVDAPAPSTDAEARILDAALVLVARWGVAKTALGDVAKEAGCSRATLYRAFPGGKQHLFLALATRELTTYRRGILDALDAGDELGDALTRALVVAARLLHDHDAAQFILEHEPGLLLPFLGFHQVDLLYRETAAAFGPHLERFLPADRAAWAAEWTARLFITYLFNPHERRDLASIDDARGLVELFILPAFSDATPAPRPT